MKSHQLYTITLLFVILEIDKRREISSCGQLQTTISPRLTNSVQTHRWPWHVAIFHQVNESSSIYQCGGTLISSKSILTAAHCVMVEANQISVLLGRLSLDEDASESGVPSAQVTEITRHPNYNSENNEHDIAIITLSTAAIFNNYVQPICLWQANKTDLSEVIGKFGTVVGWGLTEKGQVSNVLLKALLPVVDFYTCLYSNTDLYGRFLKRTNYCAGLLNGTSVCTGDSGGAMTFEENGIYSIRGIVSVGPSQVNRETQEITCDTMQFGLFTDVAQYLQWIRGNAALQCEKHIRCFYNPYGRERVPTSCIAYLNIEDLCGEDFDKEWDSSKENIVCTWFRNDRSKLTKSSIEDSTQQCKLIFDEISAITSLEIVRNGSRIPELSDAVVKFKNLDSLHLANNKMKIVERSRLTVFRRIRSLSLDRNEIAELDADTFDDLKNLTQLDVSDNQLKSLHFNLIKELQNLEIINFLKNQLEVIPSNFFRNNKKIREIYFSQNKLKEVHVDLIKDLENLEVLRFVSNQIESLPVNIFRNNKKIVTISFAKNQLKELHADIFKGLGNLEMIELQENQLEVLPPGLFPDNVNLKRIYLQKNKINKIESNFSNMPNLIVLDFKDNVCINDRHEVCTTNCVTGTSYDSLIEITEKIERNCKN